MMAVFRFFFTIQVAVESQPHWPATSKDTPPAAGRWACTLLSHSSVGWWKLRPGHVGQGNTSTNHPIFGGAFSSIHISFLQFGEKKMYDSVCVMCVCVCFSQRFALWNVFWFFVQQLGLNPMDLFCRQPWRLITAKLPWKPTKKRSETNFIHV